MLVFTFIESPAFERVRAVYVDDDEYAELQQFMMQTRKQGTSFVARRRKETPLETRGHR